MFVDSGLQSDLKAKESARGQSDVGDRLKAIEDTLRVLVSSKTVSEGVKQAAFQINYAAAISAPTQTARNGQHVTILDDNDGHSQSLADDSIDGLASITDHEDAESRYFGEPCKYLKLCQHATNSV